GAGRLAFRPGSRVPLEERGIRAAVGATGEPQRIDRYGPQSGEVLERFMSFGYGSATAAPVKLGGQVWGALVAAGPPDTSLPAGSERRLTGLAEPLAQAPADPQARR